MRAPRLPDSTVAALVGVRVVLVETAQPRHIGAAARAMKTMGLRQLVLVRPASFPDPQADIVAARALDVLACARVVDTLAEAVADCVHVYAISARQREDLPALWAQELGGAALSHDGTVALVFGPEDNGLRNEHLASCQTLVQIPSDALCPSLNLGAAVQLLCWELRRSALLDELTRPSRQSLAVTEFEPLLQRLDPLLRRMGLDQEGPRLEALQGLRRLLQRAAPARAELQHLHGLLSRLDQSLS